MSHFLHSASTDALRTGLGECRTTYGNHSVDEERVEWEVSGSTPGTGSGEGVSRTKKDSLFPKLTLLSTGKVGTL